MTFASGLGAGIEKAFMHLSQKASLGAEDLEVFWGEIRRALLEADCDFRLVKEFVAKARVGAEPNVPALFQSVLDQLVATMGASARSWEGTGETPQVFLLVGLNGAGKTTTAAKMARLLGGDASKTLLVGCDTRRPAARAQLEILSRAVGAQFFSPPEESDPVRIVARARAEAASRGAHRILLDAAGRQTVDAELLDEIALVGQAAKAHERLLVLDAATGQSALAVAEAFHARVPLTGVFLSRADSDARGGAVLTLAARLGIPVKAIGTGEKPDAAEVFHPDRMARRILGMGDLATLLERVGGPPTGADLTRAKRVMKGDVNLEDFLAEMKRVREMGGLGSILSLLPGGSKLPPEIAGSEDVFRRFESIVGSMTLEERRNPDLLSGARRARIARGSGTDPSEVARLVKMVRESRRFLKKGGMEKMMGKLF